MASTKDAGTMTKQELREKLIRKRKGLDDSMVELFSRRICERFFSDLNFDDFRVIHTFLPITRNKEPNTWYIIRSIQESSLPIRVSVPRISADPGLMKHFFLDSITALETNRWGINEPVGGDHTLISEIDAVLVPLLAFDKAGQRIGYGRGYYDRFLSACRPDTKKIGISFFPPVDRIDDINEFDVPLNYCITPEQTFKF